MPISALRCLPLVAVTVAAVGTTAARAESAMPLLTVIDADDGISIAYDRAALEAMPQAMYRTSTIWTEGVRDFRGVPLFDLVTRSGAKGRSLLLIASNDYSTTLPMDEITAAAPMVAMTMDGAPMTLRDKGPLWLIYPYDLGAEYQTEVVYTRSVWQLIRIEVLP